MSRTVPVIILFLFAFAACSGSKPLTPERAAAMIESGDVIVVDIRDPKKFADGHIESAINAEYHPKSFEQDTEGIDRNATLLLYCGMGLKNIKAASELERRGFKNVFVMEGGINAWKKAGFPVTGK